jgi:S1-C subfamily serine protease
MVGRTEVCKECGYMNVIPQSNWRRFLNFDERHSLTLKIAVCVVAIAAVAITVCVAISNMKSPSQALTEKCESLKAANDALEADNTKLRDSNQNLASRLEDEKNRAAALKDEQFNLKAQVRDLRSQADKVAEVSSAQDSAPAGPVAASPPTSLYSDPTPAVPAGPPSGVPQPARAARLAEGISAPIPRTQRRGPNGAVQEDAIPRIDPATIAMPPSDDPLAKLYAEAVKGVVRVDILGPKPVAGYMGSGFAIGQKGAIVTNYHVIRGANKGTVTFHDGSTRDILGVFAYDKAQDIAILATDPGAADFHPLKLATSLPPIMSTVMAIGHGEGFNFAPTEGRVQAVMSGEEMRKLGVTIVSPGTEYVRTTCQIWPGNSGGPLVSKDGEVVGVNAVIFKPVAIADPMYFAVSVLRLRALVDKASTTPMSLESVAAREEDSDWHPTTRDDQIDPIAGWVPKQKFKCSVVSDTILRVRNCTSCPNCSGKGTVTAKQGTPDHVILGIGGGIVRGNERETTVTCPACRGTGRAWSDTAYAQMANLAEQLVLLNEKSGAPEEIHRLEDAGHATFQRAAVNRAEAAKACNKAATRVLANPADNIGKPVVFYGTLLRPIHSGKDTLWIVWIYGTEWQFALVYAKDGLGVLEGQPCVVAGINLKPITGYNLSVIYACAVEAVN